MRFFYQMFVIFIVKAALLKTSTKQMKSFYYYGWFVSYEGQFMRNFRCSILYISVSPLPQIAGYRGNSR